MEPRYARDRLALLRMGRVLIEMYALIQHAPEVAALVDRRLERARSILKVASGDTREDVPEVFDREMGA